MCLMLMLVRDKAIPADQTSRSVADEAAAAAAVTVTVTLITSMHVLMQELLLLFTIIHSAIS